MTPFEQLCLLVRVALAADSASSARLAGVSFDGEALVRLSLAHKVAPFLHGLTADPAVDPHLPRVLRECLALVREANLERNRLLREQLVEILALLNGHGIVPVLLKGAGRLVDDLYPPGGRFMLDLDFLVRPEEMAPADACLQRAGYGPLCENSRMPDEHHHAPVLRHQDRLASVELHRGIGRPSHERRLLSAADLYARSRPHGFAGVTARLPALDDSFMHLFMHGQLQHRDFLNGRISLIDVVELMLMRRKAGDMMVQRAAERAASCGYHLPFSAFLLTCERILDVKLTTAVKNPLLAGLFAHRIFWQQRSPWLRRLSHLFAFGMTRIEALREYPSVRRRFPRLLASRDFYGRQWRKMWGK